VLTLIRRTVTKSDLVGCFSCFVRVSISVASGWSFPVFLIWLHSKFPPSEVGLWNASTFHHAHDNKYRNLGVCRSLLCFVRSAMCISKSPPSCTQCDWFCCHRCVSFFTWIQALWEIVQGCAKCTYKGQTIVILWFWGRTVVLHTNAHGHGTSFVPLEMQFQDCPFHFLSSCIFPASGCYVFMLAVCVCVYNIYIWQYTQPFKSLGSEINTFI